MSPLVFSQITGKYTIIDIYDFPTIGMLRQRNNMIMTISITITSNSSNSHCASHLQQQEQQTTSNNKTLPPTAITTTTTNNAGLQPVTTTTSNKNSKTVHDKHHDQQNSSSIHHQLPKLNVTSDSYRLFQDDNQNSYLQDKPLLLAG